MIVPVSSLHRTPQTRQRHHREQPCPSILSFQYLTTRRRQHASNIIFFITHFTFKPTPPKGPPASGPSGQRLPIRFKPNTHSICSTEVIFGSNSKSRINGRGNLDNHRDCNTSELRQRCQQADSVEHVKNAWTSHSKHCVPARRSAA